MNLLLTNDDGIDADGIRALYSELSVEHNCYVIAPDGERSAFSHSLSIHRDVYYEKHGLGYAVSGTPADCVKLGVLHLLPCKPDAVIAGVNNGSNLGSDIMYSGTVSAALEAAYLGIRGIAVSLQCHNAPGEYYARAAKLVRENLSEFSALPIQTETVLNINYPVRMPYAGIKCTKAGINLYNDTFVAGEKEGSVRLKGVPVEHSRNSDDCDVEWIKKGYATVTPIRLDRNDYESLQTLKSARLFR